MIGKDYFGYSYRELNWRYLSGDPFDNAHSDWRYRYNAMGEREQKRLYHAPLADSVAGSPYPWVQYILGGSKEQLAVWHGQQMTSLFCDTVKLRNVYLYPTEYLTYGVGRQSSLLTKPDGTKEYRFFDHLGSSRAVLSGSNVTFSDYAPFGGLLGGGTESRKGYIDKEKDGESSLRNFGVRQYDENSGRFISIDPLWEKFPDQTPYNYAENTPVILKDPNGDCPPCAALRIILYAAGMLATNPEIAHTPTQNPEADKIAVENTKQTLTTVQSIPNPRAIVSLGKGVVGGVKAIVGGSSKGTTGAAKAVTKTIISSTPTVARTQDEIAQGIAGGHAYAKHVVKGKEFDNLGIKTQADFENHIKNIMNNAPTHNAKGLSNNRTAYWDDKSGTVVIYDPKSKDLGTAFRPTQGKTYFDNLK